MKKLWNLIQRVHRDERGAEGLEKLLIIAAIVLPLLAILIFFRDWITEWVQTSAEDVQADSEAQNPF